MDELEEGEVEAELCEVNERNDVHVRECTSVHSPSPDALKVILTDCHFNCFDVIEKHPEIHIEQLQSFLHSNDSGLDHDQHYLLEQSLKGIHAASDDAYYDERLGPSMEKLSVNLKQMILVATSTYAIP